jgi:hypothetical protein
MNEVVLAYYLVLSRHFPGETVRITKSAGRYLNLRPTEYEVQVQTTGPGFSNVGS